MAEAVVPPAGPPGPPSEGGAVGEGGEVSLPSSPTQPSVIVNDVVEIPSSGSAASSSTDVCYQPQTPSPGDVNLRALVLAHLVCRLCARRCRHPASSPTQSQPASTAPAAPPPPPPYAPSSGPREYIAIDSDSDADVPPGPPPAAAASRPSPTASAASSPDPSCPPSAPPRPVQPCPPEEPTTAATPSSPPPPEHPPPLPPGPPPALPLPPGAPPATPAPWLFSYAQPPLPLAQPSFPSAFRPVPARAAVPSGPNPPRPRTRSPRSPSAWRRCGGGFVLPRHPAAFQQEATGTAEAPAQRSSPMASPRLRRSPTAEFDPDAPWYAIQGRELDVMVDRVQEWVAEQVANGVAPTTVGEWRLLLRDSHLLARYEKRRRIGIANQLCLCITLPTAGRRPRSKRRHESVSPYRPPHRRCTSEGRHVPRSNQRASAARSPSRPPCRRSPSQGRPATRPDRHASVSSASYRPPHRRCTSEGRNVLRPNQRASAARSPSRPPSRRSPSQGRPATRPDRWVGADRSPSRPPRRRSPSEGRPASRCDRQARAHRSPCRPPHRRSPSEARHASHPYHHASANGPPHHPLHRRSPSEGRHAPRPHRAASSRRASPGILGPQPDADFSFELRHEAAQVAVFFVFGDEVQRRPIFTHVPLLHAMDDYRQAHPNVPLVFYYKGRALEALRTATDYGMTSESVILVKSMPLE